MGWSITISACRREEACRTNRFDRVALGEQWVHHTNPVYTALLTKYYEKLRRNHLITRVWRWRWSAGKYRTRVRPLWRNPIQSLNLAILPTPPRITLLVRPPGGLDSRSEDRAARSGGGNPTVAAENDTGDGKGDDDEVSPWLSLASAPRPSPPAPPLLLPDCRQWGVIQVRSGWQMNKWNESARSLQGVGWIQSIPAEHWPSAISRCFFFGSRLFLHNNVIISIAISQFKTSSFKR
jgi:hypothetical protein